MTKPPTKNYVTKSEASRRLEINRPALDRFLSRPGAPSPNDAKRYDVRELSAFIASQQENRLDTLRDARLEEVRLRCERLRRELDLDEKKTVVRTAVDEFHGCLAHALRSILYTKLTNEMPPKIAGCDALTVRRYGQALADEICAKLSQDVQGWNSR